ncbi:MAG: tubulin-like doman-containing protein [Prevotellaceae bacterium]|jgi:hypothetical protein|nr:tubulin-like doman-containing protein [Prevotellaceae bacterium]
MAKIKLRRSLYIGLGGTGMNAILHTKKMFMETYGEVPPMVGFLGIDTDGNSNSKPIQSKCGQCSLLPSEYFWSNIPNAIPFYTKNKERLPWMPIENVGSISSLDKGAGQIRTNGRLAVFMKYNTIKIAIQDAIVAIRQDFSTNAKYEANNSTKIDVHLLFSVCGGTGGGTFIDIAAMIKSLENTNLLGYGILSDVFKSMDRGPQTKNVHPNAYAAILDLDYLMHKDSLEFNILGQIIQIEGKLFNHMLLINNTNSAGTNYTHIDEITEMLSLVLYSYPGGIGDDVISAMDNMEKNRDGGIFNVGNKKAWVETCGACEIVFKGHDIANVYAHKAAVHIINRMFNTSCGDANTIANNWIDSPEINIRENNGPENDNLINQICDKDPKFPMGNVSTVNSSADIQTYYNQVIPTEQELNKTIDRISKNVTEGLHNLVKKQINKEECSVASTILVLEDILRQVELFVGEMTSEAEDLRKILPVLENEVKVGIENLQHWHQKSWIVPGRGKHITEEQQNIADAVYKVALTQIEIKRRDSANKVFTALKNAIANEHEKINIIKSTLENVRGELSQKIIDIQNNVANRSAVFEIDLSKGVETPVNNQSIIIKEFIDSLPSKNLYELGNSQTALEALLHYTKNLPETKSWENKTIDHALANLKDDEIKHLISVATEKARPLLLIDGKGYTVGKDSNIGKDLVGDQLDRLFLIGVPDKTNSTLSQKKELIEPILKGTDQNHYLSIVYVQIGGTDKVILYRMEGVLPAFAISTLNSYANEYQNVNLIPHFDQTIFEAMKEEDFSILPKARADDDIEYWVKGFIFGFIKYSEKKYWYQDWKNGKALKDFWISTGETTRDKAYEKFKRNISPLRKQYTDKIEEKINADGKVAIKKLVEKVRSSYFDEFSQCEASKETIEKKGYEKVATLIEEELQYVESKLTASL